GTTGIVEPMSEQALIDTIRVELNQRRAMGADYALLTPGNYGADFIKDSLHIDPAIPVMVSNFIGEGFSICKELGFKGALLIGHIGKLVKLSGGMFNTHSKYGDCRMELMAAQGAAAGLSPEKTGEVLQCVSCDEALRIIKEEGLDSQVLKRLTEKTDMILTHKFGEDFETGALMFSKEYGELGRTEKAENLLMHIRKEN
ncbi:MAG: cobalt-precorrin-5B (C(1))-methyltransferase, partial [Parasporobacterium sp.]|nr:cobalt-precorrin-5B (C(1))-methyltransferase [Parasporobacterium sp.]